MKIKLLLSFGLFAIIISCNSETSVEHEISRNDPTFLPLSVGNIWIKKSVFTDYSVFPEVKTERTIRSEIVGIDIIAGMEYYKIELIDTKEGRISYQYYRFDDESGIVYQLRDNIEYFKYDLSKSEGNFEYKNNGVTYRWLNISKSDTTIFGENKNYRSFYESNGETSFRYKIVEGIGEIWYFSHYLNSLEENLLGCVINNDVYGDTSFINNFPISEYYPFSVGNKWFFTYEEFTHYPNRQLLNTFEIKREVLKDTLVNNLLYYLISTTTKTDSTITFDYERVNLKKGLIYRLDSKKKDEYLIDDLFADGSYTIKSYRFNTPRDRPEDVKMFDYDERHGRKRYIERDNAIRANGVLLSGVEYRYTLQKKYGLVDVTIKYPEYYSTMYKKGSIIDGIIEGEIW